MGFLNGGFVPGIAIGWMENGGKNETQRITDFLLFFRDFCSLFWRRQFDAAEDGSRDTEEWILLDKRKIGWDDDDVEEGRGFTPMQSILRTFEPDLRCSLLLRLGRPPLLSETISYPVRPIHRAIR